MFSETNRKKLRNQAVIIFSVLSLLFISLASLAYLKAEIYLNKNLSELIYSKTKGEYFMTFDKLDIDFSNWGLSIKNAALIPNDAVLNSKNTTTEIKKYISFNSPDITLKGIHLVNLVFRKKLKIHEIIIVSPQLNIHGRNLEFGGEQNEAEDFFSLIKTNFSNTFKSVSINKIEFMNANFDFYNLFGENKKLAQAKNITLEIVDFYTDQELLGDPLKLYRTNEIFLKINDYSSRLADSIHVISAENIIYSLKNSLIDVNNLELKPFIFSTDKNLYDLRITNATIRNKNIATLYENENVLIDFLEISEAKIKFRPGIKKTGNIDSLIRFDLYSLIKDELKTIRIRSFNVSNTQLIIVKSFNDTVAQQELQKLKISLYEFELSNNSIIDTSRVFFAKKIYLEIQNYSLVLGDNIHKVNIGKAKVLSDKKLATLENISVFPSKSKFKQNTTNSINANCDSLLIIGFDLKKAYHNKKFAFSGLTIHRPIVEIANEKNVENNDNETDLGYYYQLISKFANGIYSNRIDVKNGRFSFENIVAGKTYGSYESDITLLLSNFSLDENSAKKTDKLFYANQIELNFSNYKMYLVDQIHKLTLGNFYISTAKNIAVLKNLHLAPITTVNSFDLLKSFGRSELYEFIIPELSMTNTSFNEAFFNKRLYIDTLKVEKPQIYYENYGLLKQNKPKAEFEDLFKLLSVYLSDIKLNNMLIPTGKIKLVNHSRNEKTMTLNNDFSLKIDNMHINEEIIGNHKLLFSENIEFIIRNHTIKLADKIHVIKASEVGIFTKKKEIFVLNAKIFPETGSTGFKSVKWNVQLSIPEIRITGINVNRLYYNRVIEADNVRLRFPEIRLYQKQKNNESKKIRDLSVLIPDEFSSLTIKTFNLLNGSLKVFTETELTPYLLVQSDIKILADNVYIENKDESGKPDFKSGDFNVDLMQFKFHPKNKNMSYLFDELKFSNSSETILAKNFNIKPKSFTSKENQFEVKIPTIVFKGFDINKAYKSDQFLFESISIEKPLFKIYRNNKSISGFNIKNLDLYSYFENVLDVIEAKELRIDDARILKVANREVDFDETVSIVLNKVKIDKNLPSKILYSDNFSININDYTKKFEYFDFNVNRIYYSSANKTLTLKEIGIRPLYNKEIHQKKNGFQSDYISGKIDSINIFEPNIVDILNKNIFDAKYVKINNLDLDLYRDKTMPFNEQKKSAMIHDLIKNIKQPLAFDSIQLINSKIVYNELPAEGNDIGKIWFSGIKTNIFPFTNIRNDKGFYPDIRLRGTANLMDSCKLNLRMYYYMNNTDNLFTVSGNLIDFNFRILNPVTMPLASVFIRSGKSDLFSFSFSADKRLARGDLKVEYEDLKISVINEKQDEKKELKFASFFANLLLINSKNKGKEIIPEKIYFERDSKRSDINYWWKSVFSGVKNTLGISSDTKK